MPAARPAASVIRAAAEAAKASGVSVVIEAPGGVRITFFDGPPESPQSPPKQPRRNTCDEAFG